MNSLKHMFKSKVAVPMLALGSLFALKDADAQTLAYTNTSGADKASSSIVRTASPTSDRSSEFTTNADVVTVDDKNPEVALVQTGNTATAQDVSYMPDARYIGVYMRVDQDFPHSADKLISTIKKKYFDAYKLPVIFVKPANPDPGNGFSMSIYVGGESYTGDISNGNVSIGEMIDNHQTMFPKLRSMYAEKNPEINSPSLGMN